MKKTLAAAITSALVIGVASTTFAAANPFSDVPTDHWSFDAVAKLAHEGVIEGYGDNTFRGDSKITRYEMAQMVAKAMAKSGLSAADKATIDKLSAEYASELNNLGVRVSALEKKTDNVKFTGEARFRYDKTRKDPAATTNTSKDLFRLNASAQVNDQWTANARFESTINVDKSDTATTTVNRVWAQGPLFGATAKLGKFAEYTTQGYILDDVISGGEFQWKGQNLTTTATAARIGTDIGYKFNTPVDFYALDFKYAVSPKTNIDVAYNRLHSKNNDFKAEYGLASSEDNNNIFTIGFDTKLNDTVALKGIYAKSSLDVPTTGKYKDNKDNGYSVELDYKGATASKPGSFGLWTAYRNVPDVTTVAPTWNGATSGVKGWEVGSTYTFAKNIMATAAYFDGETVANNDNNYKHFRGQVEFFF